jgi:uncharacterized protein (DUF1800 family)
MPNIQFYRRDKASRGRVLSLAALAVTAVMLGGSSYAVAQQGVTRKAKSAPKAAVDSVSEDAKILHVLNRLGFGPRPDDVQMVKQVGLHRYIEQQLNPDLLDDSQLDRKLQGFPELQMSDSDIESKYKDFVTVDQNAAKLRRQAAKLAADKTGQAPNTGTPVQAGNAQANQAAMRQAMANDPDMRQEVMETRRQLASAAEPVGLLHEEFSAAKLLRAVESKRQLQEVLVDFWGNHFNIDIRKAPCGVLKVLDDRNVIRPHIFGKFRDLLEASAKSPAMLVYLDNFQSIADQPQTPNRPFRNRLAFGGAVGAQGQNAALQKPPAQRRKLGLNENYAREIMELHTLGVDGGYSQQDVREVARCFTGWGIGSPDGDRQVLNRYGQAGVFQFHPRVHDNGDKTVLGVQIPAGGGIDDGEKVLDILASSPATMKHISYQLCQRLVSDEPPTSLVDKCVATWKRTDGDLREIYRTIITSPEFFSPEAMRKKIKSPFEYAVSSVRALNGSLDTDELISKRQLPREANSLIRPPQGGGYLDINTNTLIGQIGTMGQPLFQYQAPTGFPEDSRKWVSSGALISRLNFSLALTQGKINDVRLDDPSENSGETMDSNALIDRIATRILHGDISPSTRATLVNEAKASDGSAGSDRLTPAKIAALLLGSPEFQRH